ncbi:MAG: BatD family protein [Phycisphaerae bacterium]
MQAALISTAILILAQASLAQDVGVELIVPSRTLELGESVDVDLVCRNMDRPDTPAAVVPDGLELQLLNPNPSSSIRIVNGHKSSKYTYTLLLTAKAVGTHVLGEITVEAGGRTYHTEPIRFVVKETPATGNRGDRYLFAELQVQPRTLYVTQNLTATLTIGIREVVIDGRRYNLDLLRDVLDVRRSKLSVFANGRATQSTITLPDSTGRSHRYRVYKVSMPIRAETVGPLEIGPIFLKANYPTSIRQSFFRPEIQRVRSEIARAPQIVVDVQGPPEAGRPDSYTGAIGRFQMLVSARPTAVELGKPITLTVSISGDGLDGVAGPNLSANAELASRFDFSSEELIGDVSGRRKVFRIAVFPKQDGPQSIPPIEWSYFDPDRETYQTITSTPISIQVHPASNSATEFTLGDAAPTEHQPTHLKVLSGGLSPNYIDVDELLANRQFALSHAWITALGAPPVCWAVIALLVWRHRRARADTGWARRRGAARRLNADLREAMRRADEHEQWAALGAAMQRYLADRFNLPPGEITPPDAQYLLSTKNGTQAIAEGVGQFLERCGAMRFAPGEGASRSVDEAVSQMKDWVRIIERATR